MGKTYRAARKILVLSVGLPLFGLGIILIPLPGPGLLVCALALFILSREFDWARKRFERVKTEIQKIINQSKDKTKD